MISLEKLVQADSICRTGIIDQTHQILGPKTTNLLCFTPPLDHNCARTLPSSRCACIVTLNRAETGRFNQKSRFSKVR